MAKAVFSIWIMRYESLADWLQSKLLSLEKERMLVFGFPLPT
jgi:hypothetical protein